MEEKIKKPIYKRWWFWAIVIVVLIAFASGGDDDTGNMTQVPDQQSVAVSNEVGKEEPMKELETPPEIDTETLSQKNAVSKAEDYLVLTAFSKSGLIEQLEFEGYSNADATYAVNKISVDWKEQAVLKGKDYLDFTSFSRSGLIEQLQFEGFSYEEANYAADTIGY